MPVKKEKTIDKRTLPKTVRFEPAPTPQGLFKVAIKGGGGKLPKALTGLFTSKAKAIDAIEGYYNATGKAQ